MTTALPADVYDALELSAYAFGGIGQPQVFLRDLHGVITAPVCIIGHCKFVQGHDTFAGPVFDALCTALVGFLGSLSDAAVREINRRHGQPLSERVNFREWCAELHIVRGA
jgi:hypothetical protein